MHLTLGYYNICCRIGGTQQVLGRLANLPVPVRQGVLQGSVDVVALEGGQCKDGTTPNGRLVAAPRKDRRQTAGVADGPESGHAGFPHHLVGVLDCMAAEGIEHGGVEFVSGVSFVALTQRPRRGLGHGELLVAEQGKQYVDGHVRVVRSELRHAVADRSVRVDRCRGDVGRLGGAEM